MQQDVEEYMANLLISGFSRERVVEMGYEYAMALQTDKQAVGSNYIPASFMAIAASTVKDALSGAYRIKELRQRMR